MAAARSRRGRRTARPCSTCCCTIAKASTGWTPSTASAATAKAGRAQRAALQQFLAWRGQAVVVACVRRSRRRHVVRQQRQRAVVPALQLAALLGAGATARRSPVAGQRIRAWHRAVADRRHVAGRQRRHARSAGSGNRQHPARAGRCRRRLHADGRARRPCGRVWISYYQGLARFDPATGVMQRWTAQDAVDAALPAERAGFAETSDGLLWMVSEAGALQARDGDGHVVESCRRAAPAACRRARCQGDRLAPDGAVWVAGSQGLFGVERGRSPPGAVPGAPRDAIDSFAVSDGRTVWLARFGALETYRWNGGSLQRLARYDQRQGLPALAADGMTVDGDGIVWLTSARGLIRFDPATRSARVYGVRDGLPSQEFGEKPVRAPAGRAHRRGDAAKAWCCSIRRSCIRLEHACPRSSSNRPACAAGIAAVELRPQRGFSIQYGDRDLRIVARLLSFDNARSHRYGSAWTITIPNGSKPVRAASARSRSCRRVDYTLAVKAKTADNVWSAGACAGASRSRRPGGARRGRWRDSRGCSRCCCGALADAYRARMRRRHDWQLARAQARAGRAGIAGEDAVPGHAGPRDPHADDRRDGHERTAAGARRWIRGSAATPNRSGAPASTCCGWSTMRWTWRASRPASSNSMRSRLRCATMLDEVSS